MREFASVTGDGSTSDATMLFSFDVPQNDAGGAARLAAGRGLADDLARPGEFLGEWTPLNPLYPPGPYSSNAGTDTLNDRSLAIQKTVQDVNPTGPAGTISPGDTLEYTINFQVSDSFVLEDLVVSDVISDGQRIDPSFTPTLLVDANPYHLPAAQFHTVNYTVTGNYTGEPCRRR